MIKLVAGGLIAIACAMIGMAIRRHYNLRKETYATLAEFTSYLSGEISYLKTTVIDAINGFCGGKKNSVHNSLLSYSDALKTGVEADFIPDMAGLNGGEKQQVGKFLKSLGKKPLDETLNEINRYAQIFEGLKTKSEDEAKRLGSMYFKLAVLVGLAIMLILA
ncbi:MAG: stage III sporulation protein AB, partial [Christensenellales bacterium]